MASETYRALFYWWNRKESSQACAERLAAFLSEIRSLHPAYASWGILDEEVKFHVMPKEPIPALKRALEEGVNRNDTDGSIIEKLGFTINLSTEPLRSGGIQISANVGCYSKWVINTFLVGPIKSSETPELVEFPVMRDLARAIIRHIEPDYGMVRSDEFDELVTDYDDPDLIPTPGEPDPGWMVYLADAYWPLPPLPEGIYHEHIPDRGHLVAVTTETFDSNNPAHVEAARRFGELLYAVDPRKPNS